MNKPVEVLFIDDEVNIVDGIKRLFMRESFGVFATNSLTEARTFLASQPVKVVVSDHRMPDILGVKFLQEVKQAYPDTVRILFTGYTDFSAAEEAINLGEVYRFISKPWKTTELISTIRQAIEHFDLVEHNRRLFEELRLQKDELEVALKKVKVLYQAQREFTSTVSHELRTPLASIKTAIDLVNGKMLGDLNAKQMDVLGRAKSNVDRLGRLINDILDLTKLESGKMPMNIEVQNLGSLIQEVVDAQKDVAVAKGLDLKLEMESGLPEFPFDRDRLVQVMNNLLSNAIKFTPAGAVTVVVRSRAESNHALVEVNDTGPGIPEDKLLEVFDKYKQLADPAHNQTGGTGLGLAICQQIVKQHGGKIWVESASGQGSSFKFILPLQERRERE